MKPLIQALENYCKEGNIQFHMPGHRQGRLLTGDFLKWDLTEVPGLDNLHAPTEAILGAQDLAAKAFGAKETYFSVNGSTAGIMGMILASCRPGDKLVVDRNCHRSVLNGLLIAGAEPIFVWGDYDRERGYMMPASEDELVDAARTGVVGVLITRPNYYGVAKNISSLADRLHRIGKLLLVDEAHGAHLGFHESFPKSAISLGADCVVQSAHKTLPALSQAAFVHTNGLKGIEKTLSILQTTSPSYPILASLDYSRHWLENQADYTSLIKGIEEFEQGLPSNFKLIKAEDPTRLVIRGPIGGYDLEKILRSDYNIQVEMSDPNNIVCILVPGDEKFALKELLKALNSIKTHRCITPMENPAVPFKYTKRVKSLRDASFSKQEYVQLDMAQGRVAADYLTPYPPGIPILCPGEEISDQVIRYVYDIIALGGRVNGVTEDHMFSVMVGG